MKQRILYWTILSGILISNFRASGSIWIAYYIEDRLTEGPNCWLVSSVVSCIWASFISFIILRMLSLKFRRTIVVSKFLISWIIGFGLIYALVMGGNSLGYETLSQIFDIPNAQKWQESTTLHNLGIHIPPFLVIIFTTLIYTIQWRNAVLWKKDNTQPPTEIGIRDRDERSELPKHVSVNQLKSWKFYIGVLIWVVICLAVSTVFPHQPIADFFSLLNIYPSQNFEVFALVFYIYSAGWSYVLSWWILNEWIGFNVLRKRYILVGGAIATITSYFVNATIINPIPYRYYDIYSPENIIIDSNTYIPLIIGIISTTILHIINIKVFLRK